jgi:hypothetical protein
MKESSLIGLSGIFRFRVKSTKTVMQRNAGVPYRDRGPP